MYATVRQRAAKLHIALMGKDKWKMVKGKIYGESRIRSSFHMNTHTPAHTHVFAAVIIVLWHVRLFVYSFFYECVLRLQRMWQKKTSNDIVVS